MARTPSTMLALGTKAPSFSLPDTDGNKVSSSSAKKANGLLVMFLSNHCPFVKHVAAELAAVGKFCETKQIGVVAIMSNDVVKYPDDSPAKMKEERAMRGYTFPYLYDESQTVAKAYRAACTPDFYLFDANDKLAYRGQLDDSRPGNDKPVNGKDLRQAIALLLDKKTMADAEQKPSIGCNIKWKPGNEPDYF